MEKRQALAALTREWSTCQACQIGCWAYKHVLGIGSLTARFFFVGEGPGISEDIIGVPFCGPAGRILHRAFTETGYSDDEWFLTNLVCCRPTDTLQGSNRAPRPNEVDNCSERLRKTMEIIGPQRVIGVGRVPQAQLKRLGIEAEALPHPAWVLRNGGYGTAAYQNFARRLKAIRDAIT